MTWIKKLAVLAAVGAVTAATIVVQTGQTAARRGAAICGAQRIFAIVDDSGSMSITDSQQLRVQMLKLLIDKNPNLTLGALEFGSHADLLFAPEQIGPNAAAMKSTLAAKVNADNGGTNYNEAFAMAKQYQSDVWIFLTDGGHNAGAYNNGHAGGPPTFVIGLQIGAASTGPDAARLQQIANDTGGKYFPQQDNSTLQATANEIDAAIHCQAAPLKVQDNFNRQGQTDAHALQLARTTKSVTLTSSWSDRTNAFSIVKVWVTRGRRVVGKSVDVSLKAKPKKLRIKRTNGETYQVVAVSNLPSGKLHFKLKATKLLAPSKVITQVTQSSSR